MFLSELQLVALLLTGSGATTRATPPPALSCRVVAAVRLVLPDLLPRSITDSTIYEFDGGKLFLIPSDRPRYEYGVLTEQDPFLFTVGAKTIAFDDSRFLNATVGHTYPQDVRVLRLRCQRR